MRRSEKAVELFLKGYNCAQAVLAAFCDVTGLDESAALKLSSSFGAGMGKLREVCGACSAMFMVAGIIYGYDSATDETAKRKQYELVQLLANKFKQKNGSIICRELLGGIATDTLPAPAPRDNQYYNSRPCVRFVSSAAEILDEYIASRV